MIKNPITKHSKRSKRSGFVLIATVSVLMLLIVLLLGVLNIASVEIKNQSIQSAQNEARTNARLGLFVAIGELQKQLGPDQRISAPAAILDVNKKTLQIDGVEQPNWLGVWNSREDAAPTYEAGRANSFRSWLVSLPDSQNTLERAKYTQLSDSNSIVLGRTLGNVNPEIKAGLVPITNSDGHYAWHVADNSLQARANMPDKPAVDIAQMLSRRSGVARSAPEVIEGFETMDTTVVAMDKLMSQETLDLSVPIAPRRSSNPKNAFNTNSVSLLTDVSSGGWKRDINTLFEMTDESNFKNEGYGSWTGRSSFRDNSSYLYGPQVALGARWNHLHAYYNSYKKVNFDRSGVPEYTLQGNLIDWNKADQGTDFGDQYGGFGFPRIAKVNYIFSYSAVKKDATKYQLQLVTDVFITLWNPYNVRIKFPKNHALYMQMFKKVPMQFEWFVNNQSVGKSSLQAMGNGGGHIFRELFYREGQDTFLEMEPGETLLFSYKNSSRRPGFREGAEYQNFGYRTGGVLRGRQIEGIATDTISVSLLPDNSNDGVIYADGQYTSQYSDFWIYDTARGRPYYEHRGEIIAQANAPFVDKLEAVDQDDVPSVNFADIAGRKQPFGAFSIEMKSAQDSSNPSMAFLQSGMSRLSSQAGKINGEWNAERLDYRLDPLTSFNSDIIQVSTPNNQHGPNHAFIGSGRTFGNGVTHMMHSGLALLPMTSLAEFQHAGVGDGSSTLRATYQTNVSTPKPPFVDYAVGNSYAHPLVRKNQKQTGNYFDHSYNANEVLWDHYFCSSLAPQTQSIFYEQRKMPEIWTQFLNYEGNLLNTRYTPYLGSQSKEAIKEEIFDGSKLNKQAFKKIASSLLLEGGFNVNSVSVDAWRAVLSGARHNKLRYLDVVTSKAITNDSSGTAFGRTKLPLGLALDDDVTNRNRQYMGYRDLSDSEIADLATEIVTQVKLRGPFLNMADFVNRQLSNDTALALKGTLQAAIDDSSVNEAIKNTGIAVTGNGKGYNFPEAANGSSATGSPGWLMQGDLLTALGSSLFVRGDTFTIRSYGDSRDANGKVVAQAYCEVVIQRVPDYINKSEDRNIFPPLLPENKNFGRSFQILSFRWLPNNEINTL